MPETEAGADTLRLPATGDPAGDSGLLSAVISHMPDAAVVVDPAGTIVVANPRAESMFGYENGTLVGSPIDALVPDRVRQRHEAHRASFSARPQTRPMGAGLELAGRRRDGTEFPVDISLAPLSAESGLVVAAVRDMTEQKRASAAQAELAAIVRSSHDVIVSTTRDGQVVNVNPAVSSMLGYDPEELIGEPIQGVIPLDGKGDFEELLFAADAGTSIEARDTQWLTKQGELIPVAVSASPLGAGAEGAARFSFIVRDIRERKTAEAELRRLLAEEQRLERQHAATAEIRLALLGGSSREDALTVICERAVELVEAAMATIVLREEGRSCIVAGTGVDPSVIGLELPPVGSFADSVMEAGTVLVAARRDEVSQVVLPHGTPDGPTLGVPIVAPGRASGALSLVRQAGSPLFTASEQLFAESLAGQAALAIELEHAKADRENLMLIGDRERIGRDLHDHVIQRLFAAGLGLQGSLSLIERQDVRERISDAIEALDETIRQIRNTIFELSGSAANENGFRQRATDLAKGIEEGLGFSPRLRFVGPVESAVPERVVPHALAVLREALSNSARHANATRVEAFAEVTSKELVLVVTDDGVGIGTPERTSGLANLSERARLLDGSFEVGPGAGGGTRLVWRVPLGV